ncbi:MAG TPA: GNAT family N-acetyltransferase [Rhodopila sp.]|nr:GNAT family N-acetyltransferase [Rhodopila sp.]
MTLVHVGPVTDFAALGERWRDLEQRSTASFFQSWTWIGCLAEERFSDPLLAEVVDGNRTVALAMFNRRRHWSGLTTLYLHESGSAELDCPYIEQNGILAEAGREAELTAACLHAVMRRNRVVLSALGTDRLPALRRTGGLVAVTQDQPAPFADLAAIRRAHHGDVLAGRSANTRQQVRRSDRYYARHGPIMVRCPDTTEAAQAWLDEMATLHQATWRARGQPGSFSRPFFRRFHQALIEAGFQQGSALPLHVSAGNVTIGILYNFVWRGRMLAYQSGFAYTAGVTHARPGLTSHHAAMRLALEKGLDLYDFLAGDARYKRSLATAEARQFWAVAGPWWQPCLWPVWLKSAARG